MKLRNKKTGEIKIIDEVLLIKDDDGDCWSVGRYASLAELNEEWEDYEPAEPLIKNEKIRKAVRAWAEVNSIKKALYAERPDRSLCLLTDMGEDDYNIDFVGWMPTLKDGEEYTIAELCGEEEKMRELKFRAFDTENKAWTFVTLGDLICGACTENGDKPLSGAKQVWEQYTGLKDKNGKEIYEGDVLESTWNGDKAVVVWNNVEGEWEHYADFNAYSKYGGSVVIGNIHENPELLGEEEE